GYALDRLRDHQQLVPVMRQRGRVTLEPVILSQTFQPVRLALQVVRGFPERLRQRPASSRLGRFTATTAVCQCPAPSRTVLCAGAGGELSAASVTDQFHVTIIHITVTTQWAVTDSGVRQAYVTPTRARAREPWGPRTPERYVDPTRAR